MTLLHDIDVDTTNREAGAAEDDSARRGRRSARRAGSGALAGERANRSSSASKALDRRRRRTEKQAAKQSRTRGGRAAALTSTTAAAATRRARKVPFVVPVVALLVLGLGLSLWLSTKAAQDSYRLGIERTQNQSLMDRRDSLKRTYESGDSAPEIARRAAKQGMIPSENPARMVVGANGKPRIVGDLEPATGSAMASINAETQKNPLATIDKSKVDDSNGLTGASDSSADTADGAAANGQTGQTDSANGQGATAATPSTTTPPSPTTQAPAPQAPAGASTNVLPSGAGSQTNGNPPSANSGQPR